MSGRRRESALPLLLPALVTLTLVVLLAGCAVPIRGMHAGAMHGSVHGGMQGGMQGGMHGLPTTACPGPAPRLAQTVVRVHLMDMGRGGMMGRRSPMRLMAAPSVVRHGEVSFVATDLGRRTHELVVLPLADGRSTRLPVGPGAKVSEQGALGEASAPCAAGAGDGLKPGTTGWVTLRLRPGRYELVCNEPHHYAAGMHAILVVR